MKSLRSKGIELLHGKKAFYDFDLLNIQHYFIKESRDMTDMFLANFVFVMFCPEK